MARSRSGFPNPHRRVGATVLSFLANPLCVPVLRTHFDGPLRLRDLSERLGGATQAMLREQVGNLREIGALERHARKQMPYTVDNELTDVGRAILGVSEMVETWLERAPQGPIALGSNAGKAAIRALTGGWSSTVLHAVAAHPRSLTELNSLIPGMSYSSIERRLSALRAARQVEALPARPSGRPYAVTDWARQAVVPLAAAGRCECRHMRDVTAPPTGTDIEAALLLAVPLAARQPDDHGSCLLAVHPTNDSAGEWLAAVEVRVEKGKITSCVPPLTPRPATWALGTTEAWLQAIVDGEAEQLQLGGDDTALAMALTDGLRAGALLAQP